MAPLVAVGLDCASERAGDVLVPVEVWYVAGILVSFAAI
jgi:hypothetical protein